MRVVIIEKFGAIPNTNGDVEILYNRSMDDIRKFLFPHSFYSVKVDIALVKLLLSLKNIKVLTFNGLPALHVGAWIDFRLSSATFCSEKDMIKFFKKHNNKKYMFYMITIETTKSIYAPYLTMITCNFLKSKIAKF